MSADWIFVLHGKTAACILTLTHYHCKVICNPFVMITCEMLEQLVHE